jgi:multimeric flavodoxin WrbA
MKKLFLPVLGACLFLASCGKADRDEDTTINETKDNNIAEIAFKDLANIMEEAASTSNALRAADGILSCATITYDTLSSPMTLMIDFGTSNCLGSDGRNRRGVIYCTFTGKYRDSSTVIVITPQNYFLNDYKIEGTKTITNNGRDIYGILNYSVVIQNGVITEPGSAWNITYNSTRNRAWIEGDTSVTINDDVYLITGTANGVGRNGNTFDVTITTALRIQLNCAYIVSGNMTVQPANLAPRYVDFGTGTCDNAATVTVNGYTFSLTLQ